MVYSMYNTQYYIQYIMYNIAYNIVIVHNIIIYNIQLYIIIYSNNLWTVASPVFLPFNQ